MTTEDVALFSLRLALGGIYLLHGARKLGWQGGSGYSGWLGSIERRGFRPAWFWAAAGLSAEIGGSLLVIAGLFTPLGAALLVAHSLVIVILVSPRGFWHDQQGLEYPLLLGVTALGVAFIGPGALSLDALFGLSLPGGVAELAVAVAVAGAVGSFLARHPAQAAGDGSASQRQ